MHVLDYVRRLREMFYLHGIWSFILQASLGDRKETPQPRGNAKQEKPSVEVWDYQG